MKSEKIAKNNVALGGEFAVLSQLLLRGYDASMTLGRTKNIDILVFDPSSDKRYELEVKTTQNSKPQKSKFFGGSILAWSMHEKHEEITKDNLFYCFVTVCNEKNPYVFRFFIVPSKVVATFVKGSNKSWYKSKCKSVEKNNKMRTFCIGFKTDKYRIDIPEAEVYENKWSFEE